MKINVTKNNSEKVITRKENNAMITCYEDYVRAIQKINKNSEFHGVDLSDVYGEIDDLRNSDHDRYQRYFKRMHKDFEKSQKASL